MFYNVAKGIVLGWLLHPYLHSPKTKSNNFYIFNATRSQSCIKKTENEEEVENKVPEREAVVRLKESCFGFGFGKVEGEIHQQEE